MRVSFCKKLHLLLWCIKCLLPIFSGVLAFRIEKRKNISLSFSFWSFIISEALNYWWVQQCCTPNNLIASFPTIGNSRAMTFTSASASTAHKTVLFAFVISHFAAAAREMFRIILLLSAKLLFNDIDSG